MKRMVCLAALALVSCFGMFNVCPAPAFADHGGQNKSVETRVRIDLTGATINGIHPEGHADFRSAGTQRQLNVEVEKVNFTNGTVLTVNVNGVAVGTITLLAGRGEQELNTKDGVAVPAVKKGDVVNVTTSTGAIVESGTF